jgi:TIR domain
MAQAAQVARRVEIPRLHVFISYASEDAVLAQAINAELKTAFSQAIIRTTLDSEIKLGMDWRTRLEEALSDADVLLIVATGRQKLSHSYTGFEVGFFSASKRDREKMRHFGSERLIIPIGILEKIPEALSDIESLNLTGTLTPFLVDEDTLKNKQRFLASVETDAAKNPLMKLFMRLKEVVQTLHPFDDDLTEDFKRRARESANRLCLTFFDEFQKRVFIEKFGERKIIVRLPTNARIEAMGDLPPDTTLEFIGGSFEVFRINPPPDRTITWSDFIQQVPTNDTTTAWTDIIKSLIITAKQDDFVENRRLIASSDRKRFFRLFVARSVVYYSGITELHIWVVEVKSRDYGDPTTTMLLKAISVGLMYRSLFLEGTSSEFSPETVRATLPNDLPKAVSEMLQELDFVLWMSTDAGLMLPRNMTLIQGGFERGELERKFREWDKLKSDLTSSALQVLRASNAAELDAAKAAFEDTLAAFCEATIPMNTEFLGNVLRLLEDIVRKGDYSGREPVLAKPALRQAKPPPLARPKTGGKSTTKPRTAAMRAKRR